MLAPRLAHALPRNATVEIAAAPPTQSATTVGAAFLTVAKRFAQAIFRHRVGRKLRELARHGVAELASAIVLVPQALEARTLADV
jgi:ribonuclease P protein component